MLDNLHHPYLSPSRDTPKKKEIRFSIGLLLPTLNGHQPIKKRYFGRVGEINAGRRRSGNTVRGNGEKSIVWGVRRRAERDLVETESERTYLGTRKSGYGVESLKRG